LKTNLSKNQGASENPTNVDEETLEKFLESKVSTNLVALSTRLEVKMVREFLKSLDLDGRRGHSTVWTFQDLINRIFEKSEDYLRNRDLHKP